MDNQPGGSRLPGFYNLSLGERQALLAQVGHLTAEELAALTGVNGLSAAQADHMIENVIGLHALPLGIALNFVVNGREVLVPMAIEEPSVVAGASFMATLARAGGGFQAQATLPEMIGRLIKAPDLVRVVVGIDPSATSTGDEAGIVTVGVADNHIYTIADDSLQGSPLEWARVAVTAYHLHKADAIIAEANNGGEIVELTIKQVDPRVNVRLVHASRGKQTRVEPISAMSQDGRDHHVGVFPALEDELCLWIPGDPSPNRLDAKVWAATELTMHGPAILVDDPFANW